MSKYTKGRLAVISADEGSFLLSTEDGCTVSVLAEELDPSRLAAAWNVCEGIDTESLETGATLADICERYNGYQQELNAARALLREVIADAGIASHIDACHRAQVYLDACDKPGEQNVS